MANLTENDTIPTCHIGFYFRAPYKKYLRITIKSIMKYLPSTQTMPCGNQFHAENTNAFNGIDIPCPCGNLNHWFVKYDINPELDTRTKTLWGKVKWFPKWCYNRIKGFAV